jgi:glutamine amidotransferase
VCELLGISAGRPRRLGEWLCRFQARGGDIADNPDGWGIASWGEGRPRIEKSPEPGCSSRRFTEIAASLSSELLLAHVRKASYPPVPGHLNTHPFVHDCCGRAWVFAHNGMVPDIVSKPCPFSSCRPDGQTDSEFAFCHLLAGIVDAYDGADVGHWLSRLADSANTISILGKFNFLLSDGSVLIAYGHDRLHYEEHQGDYVLVATEPLGDGDWQAFAPGELRVYRQGRLLAHTLCRSDDTCRL